jgi:hypothetical protein
MSRSSRTNGSIKATTIVLAIVAMLFVLYACGQNGAKSTDTSTSSGATDNSTPSGDTNATDNSGSSDGGSSQASSDGSANTGTVNSGNTNANSTSSSASSSSQTSKNTNSTASSNNETVDKWSGTYYAQLLSGVWFTLVISDYRSDGFHFDFVDSATIADNVVKGDAVIYENNAAQYYDNDGQGINFTLTDSGIVILAGSHYNLNATWTKTKPDTASN